MKILLPVDGSEWSLEAVRFAVRLAGAGLGAEVVLANVQEPANLYELIVAHDPQVLESVCAEAGEHQLQAATDLLRAARLPFETTVCRGDPAHTILELTENYRCDLVVMGARGASPLRRAAVGSVANEVLHASAVPVLIVRPDPPLQA